MMNKTKTLTTWYVKFTEHSCILAQHIVFNTIKSKMCGTFRAQLN